MRKKVCLCLALVMLLSSLSMLVGAVDFSSIVIDTSELGIIEPKVFSTATLENDFADNHVLVVLNNKSSLNFKTYSTSDFKEVKCSAVNDLTSGKKKQVETKVSNFNNSVSTMSAEGKATAIEEINKYNQIICLELADKGKENVLAAIKALQSRDDVMYAGPDYVMSLCSTTSNDTYQAEQWAISNIDLDKAWDITTGSSGVVVGVIDSGIDAYHPDLQGQIATALCADFTASSVQYIVPTDNTGHGTHVAGIIAATSDNAKGIAGTASDVKIAALRATTDSVMFFTRLIRALDYAEDVGLQILNLSAGLYQYDGVYPVALEQAIENYSGLLICAAGNRPNDNDDEDVAFYPASIDKDNILAVGASNQDDESWEYSGYGATSVDVFAPGCDILSCFPTARCQTDSCVGVMESYYNRHHEDGYHSMTGTSMAAPYVAGIAALLLSENPDLTPLQIKQKIIATCTDFPALEDECVSGGIVNAYRALLSAYSYTAMNVDSSRNIYIPFGRSYWTRVTISNSGTYSFITTGNLHTVCELYSLTEGLIVRSSNANSSTSSNFYIEQYLNAGTTVYVRITVKGTPASGSCMFYVAYG